MDTNYATQISSAASDHRNNTDLYVSYCSGSCPSSNVRHYEADFGNTSWAARALFNGNVISHATIQWNGHWGTFENIISHRLARHEMGRAFGLNHVPCGGGPHATTIWSVMGCPESGQYTLHDHDIDDIDDKY